MQAMTEPNPDLVLFRRKYYWQYALVIGALAYLFLWDPIRNWWGFETRSVEITSVRSLCASFEQGKTIPLAVDDCTRLKAANAERAGIEIRPRTFVTFTYRSPADDRTHTASMVRDLDDAGRPVAAGSRITVRLSRRDPNLFRAP